MKLKALFLVLFVAGVVASMAVAKPPPGKGNGNGNGKKGGEAAEASSSSSTGTATTGTTAEGGKVLYCHATGSKTNPYVLVRVSSKSAHVRKHARDVPAAGGTCPKAKTKPGETGSTGTTGTTSTGTTTAATTTTATTTTGTTPTTP